MARVRLQNTEKSSLWSTMLCTNILFSIQRNATCAMHATQEQAPLLSLRLRRFVSCVNCVKKIRSALRCVRYVRCVCRCRPQGNQDRKPALQNYKSPICSLNNKPIDTRQAYTIRDINSCLALPIHVVLLTKTIIHSLCVRYSTAAVDKRVRTTSLYHCRQCCIVLKPRSDRIENRMRKLYQCELSVVQISFTH